MSCRTASNGFRKMNEDLELRRRVEELGAIVAEDRRRLAIERSIEQDSKRREELARADARKSAEENAKFLGIEYRPLCACGCGQPVEFAKWTDARLGIKKGEPRKYVRCHHGYTAGVPRRGPEFNAFNAARDRCRNRRRKEWNNYGGRGILFCFVSFEQFLKEVGPRPGPEYSLDRIDVNGHYAPGNVKWSTPTEQANNRRPSSEWNFAPDSNEMPF